ncbi:MAG: hypothetical protein Q4C77_05745 [Eubacteriales bacterium]|nr:hypothetical protein [Eubacteriales bacterium]
MADSRTGNVIKNSGASLLYKGSHIIIQFALRTAFIRILGKEYGGISTLFTDILSVLSLMELGMGSAMTYALYKPLAEKDGKKISALMNFYKKAYTLIGVMVLLVGLACTPFLQYIVKDVPNIKEDIRLIFVMYVLTSSASYLLVYKTALLRADQKPRIIFMADAVIQSCESLIEIILLVIFREYFIYLILHLIATLLRNIILSYKSQRMYSEYLCNRDSSLKKEETKKLFKDIYALAIYKISGTIVNSTDSIVISAFVGTVEVSLLGNFTLIINSIRTAIEQIVNAARPSVGNLAATSSSEKQESVFEQMNFIAFWVACFCCTCFYILLNPFVGNIWFDKSFEMSNTVIVVLTANFFISVMVYPVEIFRTANGLFIQGKYRPAIMAVMNIVLDILLVENWGAVGVLLATTFSRLSTQVWFDPYLIYKFAFFKKPWTYYLEYLKDAVVTLMSCVIAQFIVGVLTFDNVYFDFIYRMIVAICVPNILLFVLYHRRSEFITMRERIIKKMKH